MSILLSCPEGLEERWELALPLPETIPWRKIERVNHQDPFLGEGSDYNPTQSSLAPELQGPAPPTPGPAPECGGAGRPGSW